MIIKEKVKPVESLADRVRNLHGHVTIDLHNHNSGFTERIEKDNLVTNALSMVLPLACAANALNEFFPIATQALGGIMLFSESLTEEAANVWFPGGSNKLVGFAGQNADESNPMSGELNALESGPITGGYTTVWDFSTAQANGTISALARTHKNIGTNRTHGHAAFTSAFASNMNTGLMRSLLYYDPHGTLYGLIYGDNNDTHIYSKPFYFDRPGVDYAYPAAPDSLTDTGLEIPSGNNCWVNGYDGYIYNYTINSTDKVITWRKMYAADESFDLINLVARSYEGSSPIQSASKFNFCIANSCCYCLSPDGQTIYKYSLSQSADVTAIPIGDTITQLTANAAGAICACSSTHWYTINANNNVVAVSGQNSYPNFPALNLTPTSADSIRFINSKSGGYDTQKYLAMYATNDYLGTIANISPVTKTASQSMKITYTLTDV